MATIEQANKERYSEKGYNDLKNFMNTLCRIYNGDEQVGFGEKIRFFGFLPTIINDKKECEGRIICLSHILGIPVEFENIKTFTSEGEEMIINKVYVGDNNDD